VINNSTIFRFPRDSFARKKLKEETRLLPHIADPLPVAIPAYCHIANSHEVAGYPLIKGAELKTSHYYNVLNHKQRLHLATDVAAFLKALHTSSFPQASRPEVNFAGKRAGASNQRLESVLKKVLTKKELHTARLYFDEFATTLGNTRERSLLHGDFKIHHLYLNPRNRRLRGVIDFGYVQLGDPAVDFSNLFALPDAFIRNAIVAYSNSAAEAQILLERTQFYQKCFGIYWMLGALEGKPISFDLGYKKFREAFR
jgi:aminoglycoside 2''-phosphotransferase